MTRWKIHAWKIVAACALAALGLFAVSIHHNNVVVNVHMADPPAFDAAKFGTGWARDQEDRKYLRAEGLRLVLAPREQRHEELDPREWMVVENQGPVGSCAGHAGSTVAEYVAKVGGGRVVQFSRMWCYLQGQRQSGLFGRDVGATISGVIEALKQDGVCYEATFPYPGRYVTKIPREAAAEAAQFKVLNHVSLRSYDEVFAFLDSGFGGIEIGITWTGRLANNRGVITVADCRGGGGGHALALLGFSKRKDAKGRQYIWLVNSHSTAWGNQGWAEVEPAAIDYWGGQQWSELIGITDLTGFERERELDFSRLGMSRPNQHTPEKSPERKVRRERSFAIAL